MGPELAVIMPSPKSLSEQGGAGTAARHRGCSLWGGRNTEIAPSEERCKDLSEAKGLK